MFETSYIICFGRVSRFLLSFIYQLNGLFSKKKKIIIIIIIVNACSSNYLIEFSLAKKLDEVPCMSDVFQILRTFFYYSLQVKSFQEETKAN